MLHAARLIGLALGLLAAAAAPTALARQATIRDSEAASHVGEDVTVEGIIANVHTSRAGNTFLNFGRPYPNQTFTAAVFRSEASQFSDLHGWEGKRVRVTGRIKLYRGRPEIILDDPDQLKAVP
jgi:DNA/RNA endonuclease YhcR with UshA esterase domain